MNMREDFPLFLTNGIRVRLYLREPRFALTIGKEKGLSVEVNCDYRIVKPRAIVYMRTPDASVIATYIQALQSGTLAYQFPDYHHHQRQVSGSESSESEFDLSVSKSSVRRMFFTIQNVNARNNVASISRLTNTYTYPNKTFVDGKITNYQVRVGGKDYPQQRVETNDEFQAEPFAELQRALTTDNNILAVTRYPWHKWAKLNHNSNSLGEHNESHKVVYATGFSTLDGDPWSGLRTRGQGTDQHMIVRVEYDAAHQVNGSDSNRYFDFWFEYTKIIHLTPTGMFILD
jgi:hypothetical protein